MIIALCIFVYIIIGMITGIWVRNRHLDKCVEKKRLSLLEDAIRLPYTYGHLRKISDEKLLELAYRDAKSSDSDDWQMLGFLSGMIWPFWFVFVETYRLLSAPTTRFMPKSKVEKALRQIEVTRKSKELQEKRKKEWMSALRTMESAGIDTEELRKLEL